MRWMELEESRRGNRRLENISLCMCIKFSKKKIKKKKMHHWKSKMALTFYIAVFSKEKYVNYKIILYEKYLNMY